MKIVILGAGQVGSSLATALSQEERDSDITIVDLDAERLAELQDRLDIRTVQGHAAHPKVLIRAGIEDAELMVAVTSSDETNIVACQVAYTLFNTPTKIARIRAAEYLEHAELFDREHVPVDVLISPEQVVTRHLKRLIAYPGALQVLDFAEDRVQMVATRADRDGLLVGHALNSLPEHMPAGVDARVAAIYRNDAALIPKGDTVVEEGDVVFFLAAKEHVPTVMRELRPLDDPARRVILAGGGNIGSNLAKHLESDHHVKLIERSRPRAEAVAEELEKTIVLVGDCADGELLREEAIDQTDVYCSLTNDDEANILSSMLAKRMGAGKVMSLINRPSYAELVEADAIDVAVSPQQLTLGSLLTHVRRGDIVRVHSLRQGAAEAIEAVAHSQAVVGKPLEDIDLPSGVSIGAIVRDEDVLIAHHDVVIEDGDHIILLVVDKNQIGAVEQLFAVGVTFV